MINRCREDNYRNKPDLTRIVTIFVVLAMVMIFPGCSLFPGWHAGALTLSMNDLEGLLEDHAAASVTLIRKNKIPIIDTGDSESSRVTFSIPQEADETYKVGWFINGEEAASARSEFTHTFNETGTYVIMVIIQQLNNAGDYDITEGELFLTVFAEEPTVGDIGPTGGFIAYDKGIFSDGWRFLELSPEDIGMTVCWDDAVQDSAAWDFGGFYDWYLPTLEEYLLIDDQLGFSDHQIGDEEDPVYWSNLTISDDLAIAFCMGDSKILYLDKETSLHVRPIRAF